MKALADKAGHGDIVFRVANGKFIYRFIQEGFKDFE